MGEGAFGLISKALELRRIPLPEARITELKNEFLDLYCENPVVLTTAFPYACETLSTLAKQGILLGVCTNKAEKAARLILERLGLDQHVQAVVGGDSGFGRKPSPTPLLACASQLGISISNVVFVGDHHIDIRAARAANVPVIACTFGYSAVAASNLGADCTIECLSQLADKIKGLSQVA